MIVSEGAGYDIDGEVLVPPVDLAVRAGECVAVRGANGAGKTTLLRMLAGRLRPTVGAVMLEGESVDDRRADVRASVASLIGVPAAYPDLTVREQLRLIGATWRFDGADLDDRIDRVLEEFAIADLGRRFAHELSSGQTQMYHLAMTFLRPFRLLLLDEPEQRLDAGRKAHVVAAIRRVSAAGATVVFASHDSAVVEAVADRVHWIGEPVDGSAAG